MEGSNLAYQIDKLKLIIKDQKQKTYRIKLKSKGKRFYDWKIGFKSFENIILY